MIAHADEAAEKRRQQYVTLAQINYANDSADLCVDSDAKISECATAGAWVQAWVWVGAKELPHD